MSEKCAKCGYSPRFDGCPHCGHPQRITTEGEDGELLMFCCRKPVLAEPETPKGVK